MVILTLHPVLRLFEPEKELSEKILYFPKKAGVPYKGHIINEVFNRAVLQPFDKLVFYACLTHIQHGGGVCSVTTLYRHITGNIDGVANISSKMRTAIDESLHRLKNVYFKVNRIHKGVNGKIEAVNGFKYLIEFDKTEKGYFFKQDNYLKDFIEIANTARTIPPNVITPYKNKSIKMLLLEYDFIALAFQLNKKNKSKCFNIAKYCDKYGIIQNHRHRYKDFLIKVATHLTDTDFIKIKSFTISGYKITIAI